MDNSSKARLLYSQSVTFRENGNPLLANQLEKLADHFGSLYVKESLAYAKKKKAEMIKPERQIKSSMPHKGLKKKALQKKTADWRASLAKNYNTFLTAGKGFMQAPGVAPAMIRNVGRGAAYAAVPLAGAAYMAPRIMRDTAESTTEGVMGKVKEYALPAALLLAGAGTAAYGAYQNRDQIGNMVSGSSGSFLPPSRQKVSHIIQGVKFREKLASSFGEHSKETDACDKAISRILFKD